LTLRPVYSHRPGFFVYDKTVTKQFLLPNNLWRTGGLFLVAFWAVFYFNGDFLHHGWFNDDRDFVRELRSFNSHGRYPQINGDPGLREVLSTWNPRHGWLYRPVFLTYLAGMFKLFGANPVALHAGNLVLHSITLVLLFVLVFRLSKSLVAGLLAALLFVYWPQHSEAIWWISCGSTLLAGLFSLATLLLWSLFREHSSRKYFAGALACFVLALCSKEDAMSLPLILLALDWFLAPQSTFRARVRLLWPFALVYAIYLACAWVGYSTYVQIQPWARLLDTRSTGSRPEVLQSFLSRLFTNPVPMSRDWFWLPLGLTCVWAGWEWRRGQRWPLFGLLWLILAALPVPLASGNHVYAPRFFYTPMLGLATVCASMCLSLWQQPVTRPLSIALGLTFLAGLLPKFSVDVTAG
jgi:hypothetical protein